MTAPPAIPLPAVQQLLALFEQHQGYLTTREVAAAGLPTTYLTRLERSGSALRLQRGVYRLADAAPASGSAGELLEVQLRVPFARPCLVSALHLHGLTTTRPTRLQFAILANRQFPALGTPPTEIFYFRPRDYDSGRFSLEVLGRKLETYTPEKTLSDLLRYAPRFGRDLYLEGLKKYLQRRLGSPTQLLRAARLGGVEGAMRLDLEVLGHDQDH